MDEVPGFIQESDIKEFADDLPIGNNWNPILVTNALLNAIDIVNGSHVSLGLKPESFTEYEMQLMREEFIERFIKRLSKYKKDRRLAYKEWDDMVGFRWE